VLATTIPINIGMTDNVKPEEKPETTPVVEASPFHEIEAFGLKVKTVDDGMSVVVWVILAVAVGYIFKVAVDHGFGLLAEWYKNRMMR
jgi:hypothetical protein